MKPKAPGERPLPKGFFIGPVDRVAKDLLGRWLVHETTQGRCVGRIVETEAYDESDPASHSFSGPTSRNQMMFSLGGHGYVYRSYGVHWCFNVSVGTEGQGAAVLIRALEPVEGLALMRTRRLSTVKTCRDRDLTRGPGRICQALAIDKSHDGYRLQGGALRVVSPSNFRRPEAISTRRVGITKGVDTLWRFAVAASPFLSR